MCSTTCLLVTWTYWHTEAASFWKQQILYSFVHLRLHELPRAKTFVLRDNLLLECIGIILPVLVDLQVENHWKLTLEAKIIR